MTVYRFEMKRQLSSIYIWTGIITAVLWLMLYGLYPLFLDSRKALEEMILAFPPQVSAVFGLDLDDIFSFESFTSMVYLYEGILGGIMACCVGISVFAREKQGKCQDFLFSKPLNRTMMFFQKLLCCISSIIIVNIPYLFVFIYSYFDYKEESKISLKIILIVLCLFLTQLVFLSFGIFAGVFLKRIRSSGGLGASIGIFAFLLSMVYSLTEKSAFKLISPLFYFSPNDVLSLGKYDVKSVITAIIVVIALTATSYVKFSKRDIEV